MDHLLPVFTATSLPSCVYLTGSFQKRTFFRRPCFHPSPTPQTNPGSSFLSCSLFLPWAARPETPAFWTDSPRGPTAPNPFTHRERTSEAWHAGPLVSPDLCWRTAPLSHTRASMRLQNVPRRPPRAKDEPRTPPRVLPVGSFFRCLLASRLPSRDQDRLMDRMNSEGVCNQMFSNSRPGRA